MPITLVVNQIPYEYPVPGDSPGWGQPSTDWAVQVTEVLNELLGADDLAQVSMTIGNSQVNTPISVAKPFNTGTVRSAVITYSVYRTSTSNPTGNAETGLVAIVYDNLAGSGSKWSLSQLPLVGNSGVTFSITDGGQLQYSSTNLGSGHSGNLHLRGKSLSQ